MGWYLLRPTVAVDIKSNRVVLIHSFIIFIHLHLFPALWAMAQLTAIRFFLAGAEVPLNVPDVVITNPEGLAAEVPVYHIKQSTL